MELQYLTALWHRHVIDPLRQRWDTIRFNVRQWFERQASAIVVAFFRWALDKYSVQKVIADQFSGSTPMCRVMRDSVSGYVDNITVDVTDVDGLDRHIDDYIDGHEIHADSIEGFEKAVEDVIKDTDIDVGNIDGLDEAIKDEVANCVKETMQEQELDEDSINDKIKDAVAEHLKVALDSQEFDAANVNDLDVALRQTLEQMIRRGELVLTLQLS